MQIKFLDASTRHSPVAMYRICVLLVESEKRGKSEQALILFVEYWFNYIFKWLTKTTVYSPSYCK